MGVQHLKQNGTNNNKSEVTMDDIDIKDNGKICYSLYKLELFPVMVLIGVADTILRSIVRSLISCQYNTTWLVFTCGRLTRRCTVKGILRGMVNQ